MHREAPFFRSLSLLVFAAAALAVVRSKTLNVRSGPFVQTSTGIILGSSNGLVQLDQQLMNTGPTLLSGKEIVALSAEGGQNLFVCYRASVSRCELRILSNLNTIAATSTSDLSAGQVPLFAKHLDYDTLTRSTVLVRGTTYFLGVPAAANTATNQSARTWIRFTQVSSALSDTGNLVISPLAREREMFAFVTSVIFGDSLYVVFSRRNVTATLLPVTFIGRVCPGDVVSSTPEFPGLYSSYDEVAVPNNAANPRVTGLYGNTAVGATNLQSFVYFAWGRTETLPAYVSIVSSTVLFTTFTDTNLACLTGTRGFGIAGFLPVNPLRQCGGFTFATGGSTTATCGGNTQSTLQTTAKFPLSSLTDLETVTRLITLGSYSAAVQRQYDFSSIAVNTILGATNVFIGTTTGEILKVSGGGASTATDTFRIYEVLEIDSQRRPITNLQFSGDDTVIYATAQGAMSEVFRRDVIDCGAFTSCGTCVNQSLSHELVSSDVHPYCRWCVYLGRCTLLTNCTDTTAPTGQSAILVSEDSECPRVTAIAPSHTSATASSQIVITTRNLPIFGSYQCQYPDFGGNSTGSLPATSVVGNTAMASFTCTSPTGSTLGKAFALASVGIFSVDLQRPLLVSTAVKLTVFECDLIARCEQCTDPRLNCGWCTFDNRCRRSTDSCASQTTTCPVVTAITPRAVSIDTTTTIALTGTGFPIPRGGDVYQCSIASPGGGLSQNISATYSAGTLTCSTFTLDSRFVPPGASGSQNLTIAPVFNGYVMTNASELIPLTGYDCSRTGSASCSVCLGLPLFTRCFWCTAARTCTVTTCPARENPAQTCPQPNITQIIPGRGPTAGGTNIRIRGANFGFVLSDIISITFNGAQCTNPNSFSVRDGVRCLTPALGITAVEKYPVVIRTRIEGAVAMGMGGSFEFRPTLVTSVTPARGPAFGGTRLVVSGTDLDAANSTTVSLVNSSSSSLPCAITSLNSTTLICTTPSAGVGDVQLAIRLDGYSFTRTFTYLPNPVIVPSTMTTRTRSPAAGGLPLVFDGTNLDGAGSAVAMFVFGSSVVNVTCSATATRLMCTIPPAAMADVQATVSVFLDGMMTGASSQLTFDSNPTFIAEEHFLVSGVAQTLTINGSNVTTGGLQSADYTVLIGQGLCERIVVTAARLTCQPPTSQPEGQAVNGSLPIQIRAGNFAVKAGGATYQQLEGSSSQSVALIAGPVAGVVFILLIVLLVVYVRYRQRESRHTTQMKGLLMQMDSIEATVASECKSAFADLQTNLDDMGITEETPFEALPFWSFDDYALKLLFPHNKPLPLDQRVSLPDAQMAELRGVLKRFEQRLLLDKKFLIPFIQTLESQRKFLMVDRVSVASLLMLAFQDNIFYSTEVLKVLLASLIRSGSGKNPKLLLRRTESVAEKLLTNWLSYCLHDYIRAEVGTPLFMLFHAMKTHIERGPVDAVTGEARNCLSEERLLRDKVDCVELMCHAVASLGPQEQRHPVPLLSCDSISQAKAKVMDAMYKTSPVSLRPPFESIDLSLVSPTGNSTIPMQDLDQTSITSGDLQQINTLGFYKVKQNSTFCITNRGEGTMMRSKDQLSILFPKHGGEMQRALSEDASKVWHLTKPQDSADSQAANGVRGVGSAKLVSEVYLTRLLSAKKTLQNYVDGLFRVVFCSDDGRVPAAIKYLFDFIDQQANEMGITDPDVIQTWKNNSVPLRFWINIIKNPEFVLDINKTATVDNCLSVIAQAFMDSCSVAEMRLTKDSPSTKLLYAKEVKENYRSKIQSYYSDIRAMRPIGEPEMQEMMKRASETHGDSHLLPKDTAVFELFMYAARYSDEISDTLEEDNRTGLVKVFESLLSETPESAIQQAQMQNGHSAGHPSALSHAV